MQLCTPASLPNRIRVLSSGSLGAISACQVCKQKRIFPFHPLFILETLHCNWRQIPISLLAKHAGAGASQIVHRMLFIAQMPFGR